MKALLAFFFGKYYHWYFVKFLYRDKNGTVIFHFSEWIGLAEQSDVLNARVLKKASSALSRMDKLPETLLRNGTLEAEPRAYLGKLKHLKKK